MPANANVYVSAHHPLSPKAYTHTDIETHTKHSDTHTYTYTLCKAETSQKNRSLLKVLPETKGISIPAPAPNLQVNPNFPKKLILCFPLLVQIPNLTELI